MFEINEDENILNLTFIKATKLQTLRKIVGCIPRNIPYINYIEIYNKLTKNDITSSEPSDMLISATITKRLNEIFEFDNVLNLCYVLENAINDFSVIYDIIDVIKQYTEKDIKLNIVYDNENMLEQIKQLKLNTNIIYYEVSK